MKLNLEIKPKELLQVALFVLLVYMLQNGKVAEALKLLSLWLGK